MNSPTQHNRWTADVGIDITFPDDKDRNEHCVEIIVTTQEAEPVGATAAYATDPAFAARIVECVNALWGITDPAGYIKMMKAHVAAQHESLGKCAGRIAELEAALKQCQILFRDALPKFNWAASALDANAIVLLNEVPLLVRKALNP